MVKFDSDYAIFGTLAADIIEGVPLAESVITYTNPACTELYGELKGKTVFELFNEICASKEKALTVFNEFKDKKRIAFEGTLAGKFVKYHSHVIANCKQGLGAGDCFVQAGITDITEIVILKELLYGTSEALRRAARAADEDTGKHVVRINKYAGLLARLAGCEETFIADISQFAQLHDIGKINIAEIIRLPRKLNALEFEIVKKHSVFGGEIVADLAGLEMAYNIALEHHEKWDGSGYPDGKRRNEISLEGRIVAIVDAFDALVSVRPYKDAFSYEKTYNIIKTGDGRVMPEHFDPKLLGLFFEHYEEFKKLHRQLKD